MVGACQQNSGIFLVRGSGPRRYAGGDRGWAGNGLGAARDRTRYRRGPRLGLGQNAGDQITWAGREQINSKESAL